MKVAATFYPELAARHGTLFPDATRSSQTKQQDVVVNIEIAYTLNRRALADRVDDALDYKLLAKRVIPLVEGGRFLLLEKLAGDVLGICSEHSDISRTRVHVEKPHALRCADSVSLTLQYHAADNNNPENGQ
ncbi:MAG: D-erythro-7,8-dihydroneopterin triphosphate epimerase [Gammaproteobacteria bacterium]|jgi:D-erythro-7,8-dihydroneopterin triphosphate epimerase